MSDKSLGRNAVWNIVEVICSSVVLFGLYKLVLAQMGVAHLGIWSLVLAITSLARIADLGAAGGLGRFVALSESGETSQKKALRYVETAILTNTFFYSAVGAALYWPAWYGLNMATRGTMVAEARSLLPYSILSFVFLNISNVISASFTGMHKSYKKSMAFSAGAILQLAVSAALIGKIGLEGVAIGQISQYLFIIIIGWLVITRDVTGNWKFSIPARFDPAALRELVGFGLRLQFLNILSFPFDPIVKFILSNVGGLQAVGLYELASRGFLQLRQVVVAPSQNLMPIFALEHAKGGPSLSASYQSACSAMLLAGGLSMGSLGILSPIVSRVWIGRVDPLFVSYSIVFMIGWFINIAAVPSYLLGIGTGMLRWNMIGAGLTTLIAAVLAYPFGRIVGPLGVALGAMIGLTIGGGLTWWRNTRALNLSCLPGREAWAELGRTSARVLGCCRQAARGAE